MPIIDKQTIFKIVNPVEKKISFFFIVVIYVKYVKWLEIIVLLF